MVRVVVLRPIIHDLLDEVLGVPPLNVKNGGLSRGVSEM